MTVFLVIVCLVALTVVVLLGIGLRDRIRRLEKRAKFGDEEFGPGVSDLEKLIDKDEEKKP